MNSLQSSCNLDWLVNEISILNNLSKVIKLSVKPPLVPSNGVLVLGIVLDFLLHKQSFQVPSRIKGVQLFQLILHVVLYFQVPFTLHDLYLLLLFQTNIRLVLLLYMRNVHIRLHISYVFLLVQDSHPLNWQRLAGVVVRHSQLNAKMVP